MPDLTASLGLFGLTFDHEVDVGMFLTFVTLVFGFLGWGYKTTKEWRRDARREAESGALRLLLKILRERYAADGGPISLAELRAQFERPDRKGERQAYCDRDFHFDDDDHFERSAEPPLLSAGARKLRGDLPPSSLAAGPAGRYIPGTGDDLEV
jgi:hypothetical protein